MAGNDWNSFMQSKMARVVLNALVAVLCAFYAVDAIKEMVTGGSAVLIEQVGSTAYYVLTVARAVVCGWVSVVFGRTAAKALSEKDE